MCKASAEGVRYRVAKAHARWAERVFVQLAPRSDNLICCGGMESIRDRAAIVGIGHTEFSKSSGRSELTLAAEASMAAVRDAGLAPQDIDGIIRLTMDPTSEVDLQNALGIPHLSYFEQVGYANLCGAVTHAAMAVAMGMASNVLIFRAMNGRTGRRMGQTTVGARVGGEAAFHAPYGWLTPAQWDAVIARRHMAQYGTTSRQLGAVAVASRRHANRNPAAIMHGRPMSLEDHQASRMVADPLRLLDCCLEIDGAGAVIVTSAERAKDAPHVPAYILAGAEGTGPRQGVHKPLTRSDITVFEETRLVAQRLFAMGGVLPRDIDVAQIYEHFTIAVIIALEDMGFCEKGEGGPFVEGGRIEIGGELPVNTSGGNLSEAYVHGITHIIEAVRQIRGVSTAQVPNAELSLVVGPNFIPTGALILRR